MRGRVAIVASVSWLAVLASRSRADEPAPETGLIVQPAIALGTGVAAVMAGSGAPPEASGTLPILRVGLERSGYAIALDFDYTTAVASAPISSVVATRSSAGVDFEPVLWSSADRDVRLYGLVGAGVDVSRQPGTGSPPSNSTGLGGRGSLALGAMYFVHPNLGIGFELGDRFDYISIDSLGITSNSVYVALAATFVTRAR
ncbi:MAG TPA: hypothetical protein VMJ10_15170 [Kofleriaceae bacterium]|nr:hypothetical protein [Kofleriaceae bacterium]